MRSLAYRSGKNPQFMISFLVGFIAALALFAAYSAFQRQSTGAAIEAQISAGDPSTCAAQGGNYCSAAQRCTGKTISASDLEGGTSCCLADCVPLAASGVDLNGDGSVDQQDIDIVKANFQKPAFNPIADVNRDGVVDIRDVAQVAKEIK